MNYEAVNIDNKLELIGENWTPKIIEFVNNYEIKLAKVKGDFTWHDHADTDEMFLVIKGSLRIDFRDGAVELDQGELFVVPRGKEHKPYAEEECSILLFEPKGVINTGGNVNDLTSGPPEKI